MSSPFDLISSELGIGQGMANEYTVSRQQAAAVAANQQLLMRNNLQMSQQQQQMPQGNFGQVTGMPHQGQQHVNQQQQQQQAHRPKSVETMEKTERRRKREREAARRSRMRKLNRVEELELKLSEMEKENSGLRDQLRLSNVDTLLKERDEIIEAIQLAVDSREKLDYAMNPEQTAEVDL
ncbi:unnamed protein product, partial [marine sediment metagenome]